MAESSRARNDPIEALERKDSERAEKRRGEGRHILGEEKLQELQAKLERFEQHERNARVESHEASVLRDQIINEAKQALKPETHLATVSLKGRPYDFTEVYTEFVPGSQRYFRQMPGGGINELYLSPNHNYQFKEWDPINKEVRRYTRERVQRATHRGRIEQAPAPQVSIGRRAAAMYGLHRGDWISENRRF